MCAPAETRHPGLVRGPAIRLVPGRYHLRGHVLPGGGVRDVYVVDGRITFEPAKDAKTLVDGAWLVPGLVDGHAHLSLGSPAGPDAAPDERITASARAQLDAGVLLIREPGSPDHGSRHVGPRRDLPRVVTAGRFIAPPGRYFPGLARETTPAQLAVVVAEEAAAGSGWVKIVGDFLDEGGRFSPNWDATDLTAAVVSAHAAGARITIHAISPEAVSAAVDAGFDAIEHGTAMPRDLLADLVDRDITWVPTMVISDGIRAWARQSMDSVQSSAVDEWLDALPATVAAAERVGVRLLAGTDAGMLPHGLIAAEVGRMVRAGVSGAAAVAAASWDARSYLRMPGTEEGEPADLVAYSTDPRSDPESLTQHTTTILDGRLVTRVRQVRPARSS